MDSIRVLIVDVKRDGVDALGLVVEAPGKQVHVIAEYEERFGGE